MSSRRFSLENIRFSQAYKLCRASPPFRSREHSVHLKVHVVSSNHVGSLERTIGSLGHKSSVVSCRHVGTLERTLNSLGRTSRVVSSRRFSQTNRLSRAYKSYRAVTWVRSREHSALSSVRVASCRHVGSLGRTFGSLGRKSRIMPPRRFARENIRLYQASRSCRVVTQFSRENSREHMVLSGKQIVSCRHIGSLEITFDSLISYKTLGETFDSFGGTSRIVPSRRFFRKNLSSLQVMQCRHVGFPENIRFSRENTWFSRAHKSCRFVTPIRSREHPVRSSVNVVSSRRVGSIGRTFGSLRRTSRVLSSRRFSRDNIRFTRAYKLCRVVSSVLSGEHSVLSGIHVVSCHHVGSLGRTFGSLGRTGRVVSSRRFARENRTYESCRIVTPIR